MSSSVQIKVEGSVKWIDVNRKVLIDYLLEHSDGRYANIKNKKSAWKLVVVWPKYGLSGGTDGTGRVGKRKAPMVLVLLAKRCG